MKILFVNEYIGSPYHGMVYRQYYLARELTLKGHEVWIVTASNSHLLLSPPETHEKVSYQMVDGINYLWLRMPFYKYSKSVARIRNMFLFMLKALHLDIGSFVIPDIIIASSPSVFSINPALKWSKKLGSKVIFEVMDIWPLTLLELTSLSKNNLLIKYMKKWEEKAYIKSDAVVSVLGGFDQYLNDYGYSVKKYSRIPNGLFMTECSENSSCPINVLEAIKEDKIVVGYVGTLGIANGLESFIEAAKKLSDDDRFQFLLVGDGGERDRLEKLAKGLGNVTFTDKVNKADIPKVLEMLDICYLGVQKQQIFNYGISPTKLPEYMHSGRPVVGAVAGYTDIIDSSGCGISVEAENSDAIVTALLTLAEDPEMRFEMGQKGKAYVESELSYSVLAERYEELIFSLL